MVKHTIQFDKNECGIACLKMFYDFFEVNYSYNDLLNEVKINEDWVTIDEMLKILHNLALFKAYEISNDMLKSMCPSIILLNKSNKSHYIVVWKY